MESCHGSMRLKETLAVLCYIVPVQHRHLGHRCIYSDSDSAPHALAPHSTSQKSCAAPLAAESAPCSRSVQPFPAQLQSPPRAPPRRRPHLAHDRRLIGPAVVLDGCTRDRLRGVVHGRWQMGRCQRRVPSGTRRLVRSNADDSDLGAFGSMVMSQPGGL